MDEWILSVLYQRTHSAVSRSTSRSPAQFLSRAPGAMHSVLNSPIVDSINALSSASPTVPIEPAMPAAAYALDTGDAHQSADLIASELQPGPAGGVPHLSHPVHTLVPPVKVHNFVHPMRFLQFGRSDRTGQPAVVGLRGDLHAVLGQH